MPRRLDHRGSRLAYEVQGQGPPVLLIQGVGVHGNGWRPQVEALSDRYTCLTFDNRGMGESQPAGATVTVEQMADDAMALLDAAGWESAHVIGHSLGGLVALELALAARRRVRSLALLCTFASGRDAAPPTARMIWIGLRTRVGTRRMRRRAFLQLVMSLERSRKPTRTGWPSGSFRSSGTTLPISLPSSASNWRRCGPTTPLHGSGSWRVCRP